MGLPRTILEFDAVTAGSEERYDSAIWKASLVLRPGELALVRLEEGRTSLPLADVAEGLVEPTQGTVTFLQESWSEMSPRRAARHRGTIGRIFDDLGWISDLDVAENITLAQRHQAKRPWREIEDEAAGLARMFGLPGLPRQYPAEARSGDLFRAACVRALLGKPVLIILERPPQRSFRDVMPPLINALRSARERGAGILWTTDDGEVWADAGIRPTQRYVMSGAQLILHDEQPQTP